MLALSGGMGRIYSGEPLRINSLHRWSRYSLECEAMDSVEHFTQEYEHADCGAFNALQSAPDNESKFSLPNVMGFLLPSTLDSVQNFVFDYCQVG